MRSTVKDFMTKNVIKLLGNDTIMKAAAQMVQHCIDGIPVVDDQNRVIGLITKSHALRAIGRDGPVRVSELMKTDVVTTNQDTLLEVAYKHKVGRLPVLDNEGKLVGMITRTDVRLFWRQVESTLEDLSAIMNSGHNGIIAIDLISKIKFMNKAVERLIGFPMEDGVGKQITDLLPDIDFTSVLQTGVTEAVQQITIGQKKLLVNKNPVIRKGKIIGAVAAFHAIPEAKNTAHELERFQAINNEINAVTDLSTDGFVIANDEGVMYKSNNIGREMLPSLKPNNGIKADNYIDKINEQNLPKDQTAEKDSLFEEYLNDAEKEYKERLRSNVVFQSAIMTKKIETAIKVAQVNTTVLILGESGVGKEQIARIIHEGSSRISKPFVKFNCASIPANLFESELFGYEAGTFTGASKEGRPGLFEIANGGTVFLDEIGELPIEMQPKLLRVLQESEILRIGGRKPISLDVRIIAATNREIESMVTDGRFRRDLFYRLNVISIRIPSLRERREEIPALIHHFLLKYNLKHKKRKIVSSKLIERLFNCEWEGNIRELENTIERIVVLSRTDFVDADFLTEGEQGFELKETTSLNLREALENTERNLIEQVYRECKSTRKAAIILGVHQSTVVKKINKYAQR